MLRALFSGGIVSWMIDTLCMLPAIVVGLSFHEFAHAWVADKCGDPTPRAMGRVSLDPKAHIDPMGFLALMLIHFGWGRPVVINPYNFKSRRRDSIFVGLAGVTMNFVIGTSFGLAIRFLLKIPTVMFFFAYSSAGQLLFDMLLDMVVINYGLMFFNLIPVPPLDGFGVIVDLFNLRGKPIFSFMYKNSMIILLVLIILDVPSYLITTPLNYLVRFVCF